MTNNSDKISNNIFDQIDTNPHETEEWIESIEDIIESGDFKRVNFILGKLIDYTERRGIRVSYSTTTPFINTIQPNEEPEYPGNRKIERRIKSIIRWNAMAMVVRANKENHGIGGHISSYASAATLYEVGFNHFFKASHHSDGPDLVMIQGHSSPGIYGRAFLEDRLKEEHLYKFRQELSGGISSYPHPWLMPNFWQFATVSMGLSPIMAIYQARFMRYLYDRNLIKQNNRFVWAFCGDGEMDEPESMGALSVASREKLDNLIFVINCNLQRLDGPVRGNGSIIQELESKFRGSGWNVIKVVWGSDWDQLIANDKSGKLAQRMEEIVDGELLKYIVEGGEYTRKEFWGKYPELLELIKDLNDEDIMNLRLGGHDPQKVFSAYHEAVKKNGKPTAILARTIKGYGLGEAGEGRNITHQQKELNEKELIDFKNRFNIPITDQDAIDTPFFKPAENSEEIFYLKKCRKKLGGFLPQRNIDYKKIKIPKLELFSELLNGYEERELSTTMAFVRLLTIITKEKEIGKFVIPIIPDEARTFGIDPLFRQIGIYSHAGQLYDPVDSKQFLFYKESKDGQILEEGISEAGAMSSFIASGMSYSTHSIATIPFYIFYSMFGFQRIWDFIWAACDMRVRGFLIGGTAGRTTLNGEGLQHQDGHSLLAASVTPNIKAYDLAYSYEIAIIIHQGLVEMYQKNRDIIYYITLENENYKHPKMPQGIKNDIINGMYKINSSKTPVVRLLGSGPLLRETIEAAKLLKSDWNINPGVWCVTSFSELRKNAEDVERWNIVNSGTNKPKISQIEKCFSKNIVPTIAVSDYVKLVAEQIAKFVPGNYYALGTDGFGRSDTRQNLRSFFEVDRYYIVLTAIKALELENKVDMGLSQQVIKKYKLDSNKKNPANL